MGLFWVTGGVLRSRVVWLFWAVLGCVGFVLVCLLISFGLLGCGRLGCLGNDQVVMVVCLIVRCERCGFYVGCCWVPLWFGLIRVCEVRGGCCALI